MKVIRLEKNIRGKRDLLNPLKSMRASREIGNSAVITTKSINSGEENDSYWPVVKFIFSGKRNWDVNGRVCPKRNNPANRINPKLKILTNRIGKGEYLNPFFLLRFSHR
jgi:hypothetical protein